MTTPAAFLDSRLEKGVLVLTVTLREITDELAGPLMDVLVEAVIKSGITAIAYETIKDSKGTLPLLTPMSEVAGRMSIQEGAKYLERPFDGRGILLAGVPGVPAADPNAPTKSLADVEMEYILQVYAKNNLNKQATATELGISLKTLYNKLHKYEEERRMRAG